LTGHREANEALWRKFAGEDEVVGATRAYVAPRTAEGLSKRKTMCCLKREVARDGLLLLDAGIDRLIWRAVHQQPAKQPRQLASRGNLTGLLQLWDRPPAVAVDPVA
jgi:hypothetical protein